MTDRQADPSKADEPLVILCRTGQYQHAELMRQTLEAEGIPCTIDGENAGALWGLGAEACFAMKVLVRQSDRPRAVEILKELEKETEQEIDVIEEE
jgi:hypothetical protein